MLSITEPFRVSKTEPTAENKQQRRNHWTNMENEFKIDHKSLSFINVKMVEFSLLVRLIVGTCVNHL